MAIDVNNSRFCLGAARRGVSFERTLTLGRLGLFVPPDLLRSFFDEFALSPRGDPAYFAANKQPFCEGFFEHLGAKEVASLDFSDYEGATFVHDLSVPVPESLHGRFDAVVDGGTMEHIFNFPAAIANAMMMVRPGGHLLLDLPANNCCGHGFYQFSPELFLRLFSPERGWAAERVLLAEDSPFSPCFEVRDPAATNVRAMLNNAVPTHVFVLARRLLEVPHAGPVCAPAQADYTATWAGVERPPTGASRPVSGGTARGLVETLRQILRYMNHRAYWRFSVRRNVRRDLVKGRLTNPDLYQPTEW